jgi:hydroxyacylglutathione hydrolase
MLSFHLFLAVTKIYIETLDKADYILNTHKINFHIPGHGNITDEQQEIEKRINESRYYLNNLLSENDVLEKHCLEKYVFYDGIAKIHFENIKLAKKEIRNL